MKKERYAETNWWLSKFGNIQLGIIKHEDIEALDDQKKITSNIIKKKQLKSQGNLIIYGEIKIQKRIEVQCLHYWEAERCTVCVHVL